MKWLSLAVTAIWLALAVLKVTEGDLDWIVALGAAGASASTAIAEFHVASLKREVCDYHTELMRIYRGGDA